MAMWGQRFRNHPWQAFSKRSNVLVPASPRTDALPNVSTFVRPCSLCDCGRKHERLLKQDSGPCWCPLQSTHKPLISRSNRLPVPSRVRRPAQEQTKVFQTVWQAVPPERRVAQQSPGGGPPVGPGGLWGVLQRKVSQGYHTWHSGEKRITSLRLSKQTARSKYVQTIWGIVWFLYTIIAQGSEDEGHIFPWSGAISLH